MDLNDIKGFLHYVQTHSTVLWEYKQNCLIIITQVKMSQYTGIDKKHDINNHD